MENWINFDLRWTDMITTFRAFATGVRELKTLSERFVKIMTQLILLLILVWNEPKLGI